MKPITPRRLIPLTLFAATISLTLQTMEGGIVIDPTLYDIIDPPGSVEVNITAPGSVPKATLQALEGFGVIQTFTGFTAGANVISFTDPNRSDVRISFSGDYQSSSGDNFRNEEYVTSGDSGVRVVVENRHASTGVTVTIDFGEWDGESFNSGVNSVAAVGFTLSAPTIRFERVTSVSAQFLDPHSGVLATQTISTSSLLGDFQGLYFGYMAEGGNSIGSVALTVNVALGRSEQVPLFGLDDLGFTTVIPEPASSSLLVITGILLVALGLRRHFFTRNNRC